MGRRIILWLAAAILVGGVVDCVMASDGPLFGMERFANMKRIETVAPRRAEDIKGSRWGVQLSLPRNNQLLRRFKKTIGQLATPKIIKDLQTLGTEACGADSCFFLGIQRGNGEQG
ncbi:MAG: hypothetical protein JSW66_04290 [Phycisphaerales bacterium]|nr:MAG: hypothetical protein JSW66_04290 [Phycisphaerales bacterium]